MESPRLIERVGIDLHDSIEIPDQHTMVVKSDVLCLLQPMSTAYEE